MQLKKGNKHGFVKHLDISPMLGWVNVFVPRSAMQLARVWYSAAICINLLTLIMPWFQTGGHGVRWNLLAYLWLISAVLQGLGFVSVLIAFESIFHASFNPFNDEPIVNPPIIVPFDVGYCTILALVSSVLTLVSSLLVFFAIRCKMPRPYSHKRAYLAKLREMQKELVNRKKADDRERHIKAKEREKGSCTFRRVKI